MKLFQFCKKRRMLFCEVDNLYKNDRYPHVIYLKELRKNFNKEFYSYPPEEDVIVIPYNDMSKEITRCFTFENLPEIKEVYLIEIDCISNRIEKTIKKLISEIKKKNKKKKKTNTKVEKLDNKNIKQLSNENKMKIDIELKTNNNLIYMLAFETISGYLYSQPFTSRTLKQYSKRNEPHSKKSTCSNKQKKEESHITKLMNKGNYGMVAYILDALFEKGSNQFRDKSSFGLNLYEININIEDINNTDKTECSLMEVLKKMKELNEKSKKKRKLISQNSSSNTPSVIIDNKKRRKCEKAYPSPSSSFTSSQSSNLVTNLNSNITSTSLSFPSSPDSVSSPLDFNSYLNSILPTNNNVDLTFDYKNKNSSIDPYAKQYNLETSWNYCSNNINEDIIIDMMQNNQNLIFNNYSSKVLNNKINNLPCYQCSLDDSYDIIKNIENNNQIQNLMNNNNEISRYINL